MTNTEAIRYLSENYPPDTPLVIAWWDYDAFNHVPKDKWEQFCDDDHVNWSGAYESIDYAIDAFTGYIPEDEDEELSALDKYLDETFTDDDPLLLIICKAQLHVDYVPTEEESAEIKGWLKGRRTFMDDVLADFIAKRFPIEYSEARFEVEK